MSVVNIAMWFYCSLAESKTTSQLFREQRQKRSRRSFRDYNMIPYRTFNGHANYLRKIIIIPLQLLYDIYIRETDRQTDSSVVIVFLATQFQCLLIIRNYVHFII